MGEGDIIFYTSEISREVIIGDDQGSGIGKLIVHNLVMFLSACELYIHSASYLTPVKRCIILRP